MMKRTLSMLLASSVIAACASPRPAKVPETLITTVPVVEETAPAGDRASLEEFAGLETGQTYSLTVKNAELQDAMLLLSRKTGRTIIPDRDVTGRVTVDLQDRTLKDILMAILKPGGYTVYVENGIIRASRPRLISKTFSINYIKDRRTSTSTMNASISDSGNTGSSTAGSSINLNVSTGGSGGASGGGSGSGSPQGNVSVQTSGVSDFWSEMVRGLEVIVFGDAGSGQRSESGYSRGDKSGRKLVVNALAGLVHIRDYSDNMEHIKAYLEDVEKAVKRQVLIQAHIVEVTLNNTFSLGVDWTYARNLSSSPTNPTPLLLSQSLVPVPPTNAFQFSISNNKVTALLDAMKEQGQLKMLSSPKVSTLNNQKAVIKLITKEVSWFNKTTTTGNPPVTITDNIPQIDEVGIFLDVTPQITGRGVISMQVHPSISDKTKTSFSPDGKSSKPVIDVREVDTLIDVKNGETIVIAGLISDKVVETRRSVPWLGDIPFLGAFFRYTLQEHKKTELVMLITPYVLTEKSIADIRKEHEERMNKAGRPFVPTPLPQP